MPERPADPLPDPLPLTRLAGVFGCLFCGYAGLAAAIPVLPRFVEQTYGATEVLMGLVVTATAISALVSRPIVGMIADVKGCRRVMAAGALLISVGGFIYLSPLTLPLLVLDRLIIGVGEAALFVAGAIWTIFLAPENRRGQAIGLYGVSMWGGIGAGSFVGAQLVPIGYLAVWLFAALAPLAGLAMMAFVSGEPPRAPEGRGFSLMLRPTALPGLGLALASAGYVALAAFIVLHLDERGVGSGALVLSVFSFVYAGTRLFIGHFPDRYGPRRVATISGLGEAAGLIIVALAPSLTVAIAGAIVMGVGFSLLHPSLALIVVNAAGPSHQGAALGTYTSFWDLGLAAFGPLTGLVAGAFGYPQVFYFAAICALAASALAFLLRVVPVFQPHTAEERAQ